MSQCFDFGQLGGGEAYLRVLIKMKLPEILPKASLLEKYFKLCPYN
jgi:hypothetical protein